MSVTSTRPLTGQQLKILQFIGQFFAKNLRPPVLREICDEFGFASANGAMGHLKALAKKGYIKTESNTARGYVLVGLSKLIKPIVKAYLADLPRKTKKKTAPVPSTGGRFTGYSVRGQDSIDPAYYGE